VIISEDREFKSTHPVYTDLVCDTRKPLKRCWYCAYASLRGGKLSVCLVKRLNMEL